MTAIDVYTSSIGIFTHRSALCKPENLVTKSKILIHCHFIVISLVSVQVQTLNAIENIYRYMYFGMQAFLYTQYVYIHFKLSVVLYHQSSLVIHVPWWLFLKLSFYGPRPSLWGGSKDIYYVCATIRARNESWKVCLNFHSFTVHSKLNFSFRSFIATLNLMCTHAHLCILNVCVFHESRGCVAGSFCLISKSSDAKSK